MTNDSAIFICCTDELVTATLGRRSRSMENRRSIGEGDGYPNNLYPSRTDEPLDDETVPSLGFVKLENSTLLQVLGSLWSLCRRAPASHMLSSSKITLLILKSTVSILAE